MFEDALLDLLHAVVVVVENLLGALQVEIVLRVFAPGKRYERLQIGELHIELRTLGIQVVELIGFLTEHFFYFVRPVFMFSLAQEFALLHRLTITHLSLHIFNLLLEDVITLLFVDVLTGLVADIGLQVLEVDLTIDDLHHPKESLLDGFGSE